jgi:predicted secreted Zn-dependent protease
MLRKFAFLGSMLALAALPALGEPLVRISTSYYYIEGASALVLTEQINQLGPKGPDGRRHPARTQWHVQWKFRHNARGNECRMDEATVAVGISNTRPRWRGEKTGPASLQKRWARLTEAVERAEQHHRQQATRAGEEILAALQSLPPARNCQTLIESANHAANEILYRYQSISEEYDRRTDYGRKDGATLI